MGKSFSRLWGLVLLLIPVSLLLATQFRGVDFGQHWDESFHFQGVQRTIQTGVFLPGAYTYPSVPYWLIVGASLPEFVQAYFKAKPGFVKFQGAIAYQQCTAIGRQNVMEWAKCVNEKFGLPAHHMRVRKVFICFAALTVLWVYITTIILGYSRKEGLLAACLLAFSWEVAYHSRWIAPDAIMMQFVALTGLCYMCAIVRSSKVAALFGAALFAALATGAKYTAGLILIPVLISVFMTAGSPKKYSCLLLVTTGVLAVFAGAYLLTTPATVLEPLLFWQFLAENVSTVYSGGWYGYTVQAGWQHLGMNVQWIALCLLSKYKIISLVLFIISLVGMYSLWQRSRILLIVLVSYPLVQLLFMSMKWAMIVRNLLVVAPFLAILAARGVFYVYDRIRFSWLRVVWLCIIAAMVSINGAWLVQAAGTIQQRGSDHYLRELASYIDRHPSDIFWVSPVLRQHLEKTDGRTRLNLADNVANAQFVCAYHRELGIDKKFWWFPANDPFMSVTWFGPMEVNMNYYPAWAGDHHIMVIKSAKLSELVDREQTMRGIWRMRRLALGLSTEGI